MADKGGPLQLPGDTRDDVDEPADFFGETAVVPPTYARQSVGNPIETRGKYFPIVGSGGDLLATADRVGYEIALPGGARNSRRLAGDTPGDINRDETNYDNEKPESALMRKQSP